MRRGSPLPGKGPRRCRCGAAPASILSSARGSPQRPGVGPAFVLKQETPTQLRDGRTQVGIEVQTLEFRQVARLIARALLVLLEAQAQLAVANHGYPEFESEGCADERC